MTAVAGLEAAAHGSGRAALSECTGCPLM